MINKFTTAKRKDLDLIKKRRFKTKTKVARTVPILFLVKVKVEKIAKLNRKLLGAL